MSITGLIVLCFIYWPSHLSSKMDCQLPEGTAQISFVFIFLVYSLTHLFALGKYLLSNFPDEGDGRYWK